QGARGSDGAVRRGPRPDRHGPAFSVTVSGAGWARAVATRTLVAPPARSARRVIPRRTMDTTLARSPLAMPGGALPAEPTVRAGRQRCDARRRQQEDQPSSPDEVIQHGPSLASRSPLTSLDAKRVACENASACNN